MLTERVVAYRFRTAYIRGLSYEKFWDAHLKIWILIKM